ncbi:MAG: hypothetical protein KJ710_04545 [Candidatus Omnitrophica bacterium]|nr:hypothetical protein [Candidatus Omnitrophota bacterium]MBU1923508.1 hypothetical protein [Candidatus Omnitrophota bacterium]
MGNKADQEKVKKGFFSRVVDKLDKKMQEKAKTESKPCCGGEDKIGKKSCCS